MTSHHLLCKNKFRKNKLSHDLKIRISINLLLTKPPYNNMNKTTY